MAFYGLRFAPGDRILTARAEYASNVIAFLQVAARTGAVVEVVENDGAGQLDIADLRRRLADDNGPVKLVAVTHVPTQGGLVNPAEEIGAATREAGVPFLLDACQSIGQLPVDVERIGCDVLSATGRKFLRGPRGTGFLYVRSGFLEQIEPPFLDLHTATWTAADTYRIRPDARRLENWETNYAAKIGLGIAIDYALSPPVLAWTRLTVAPGSSVLGPVWTNVRAMTPSVTVMNWLAHSMWGFSKRRGPADRRVLVRGGSGRLAWRRRFSSTTSHGVGAGVGPPAFRRRQLARQRPRVRPERGPHLEPRPPVHRGSVVGVLAVDVKRQLAQPFARRDLEPEGEQR